MITPDKKNQSLSSSRRRGSALLLIPAFAGMTFIFIAGEVFATEKNPPANDFINLRLRDAIQLSYKNHVLMRLAREKVGQSEGLRMQTLSELLPNLSAAAYQQRVWALNLAAFGMPQAGVAGPFNDFDARFIFTQKLLDLSAASRDQIGRIGVEIAKLENDLTRQKVHLTATAAYLEALRAYNYLRVAVADRSLAERLILQASHQEESGIATGVDVARARTRVAQERLRLFQARFRYREAILGLCRATGLSLKSNIRLLDSLHFFEDYDYSDEATVTLAQTNRLEIKIAEKAARVQEYKQNEAGFQYVPKVELAADYGYNSPQINDSHKPDTGQGMISARMPLFEGGLIQGQMREAGSRRVQALLILDDTKKQVEQDARLAIRRMNTARESVLAAKQVVSLSQKELEMARNRFAAGAGDNVEVLSAQTVYASAKENYVAALAEYHLSRANFYSARGKAEEFYLETVWVKEGL